MLSTIDENTGYQIKRTSTFKSNMSQKTYYSYREMKTCLKTLTPKP